MSSTVYRYNFDDRLPMDEVEATLALAIMAVQTLHGDAQVHLDASHYLDVPSRTCVIEAGTDVGRDFNRLFAGFLAREFGDAAFRIDRVTKTTSVI